MVENVERKGGRHGTDGLCVCQGTDKCFMLSVHERLQGLGHSHFSPTDSMYVRKENKSLN